MSFPQQTHFIGVLPPEDLSLTLEDCRRYMRENYGCKSGHGTPIHVTLVPPFHLPKNILPKTWFKQWSWKFAPSPDVQYQWNLEVLSCIASMLSEVFNKEYESGEKDTYDYGKEMKKFYGKKFSVSQCHFYMI